MRVTKLEIQSARIAVLSISKSSFDQATQYTWRIAAWCALVCFLTITGHAERLPVKTLVVADGLLRDNVTKVRQDSRGFMWFCTADGLSRFDGHGFRNFTTDDGLPDRRVNDFLETQSKTILIATDAGIARLNPRGLATSTENPLFSVYVPDDQSALRIGALFEDASGTIWVGTSNGLFKLVEEGNTFIFESVRLRDSLPEKGDMEVLCLVKDTKGTLWVGTQSYGLFRLIPGGEIRHYTINVASMLEDRSGRIWAAMAPDDPGYRGLILLAAEPGADNSIIDQNYTSKDGLPGDRVQAIYQGDDNRMWVGTVSGLCSWQGNIGQSVCRNYTGKNGLCDQEIWSITEDKDGNLWTGTRCGAKKMAKFGFTTFTETDGLALPIVNSVFENQHGELLVSVNIQKRPVSRFDGAGFTLVKPNFPANVDSFGWGWKQTVWQDSVGEWWFPTARGLYRFSKTTRFEDLAKYTPRRVETGASANEVFRIFEDSRGDIWIATTQPNELLRWERTTGLWQNFTHEAGFSTRRIGTAFAEDRSGNLWIATGLEDAALIRYSNGRFRIFAQSEGVPKGWTRDLFLDHAGRLWLANTTAGVLRSDDPNAENLGFLKYTTAEGLSSNGSYCLTEDEFGRLYIGSGRGLDRLNPETGQIENFTTADGLPDSDVEVAYRDRHNALWFATTNGLTRFTPEPERPRAPPIILITGLRIAGTAQPISILGETDISNLELASDQRHVTIDFVGLGANLGEKLRYEYRFAGEHWTQTNERTLDFANLAPGNYRFELRAITGDRIHSQLPAFMSFDIAFPIWQRWWFILPAILLAALIIYGVFRFRVSRLLAVADMRTRIATDLHDDIGANLTKIAILSEVAHQRFGSSSNGDNLLPSIAEISRESISAMSDIVWAINPKKDSLNDLTIRMRRYAQEVFERQNTSLEFKANGAGFERKLNADRRRNIYLIFKEAINNVVRHSGAHEVEIHFSEVNGELIMSVKDDGSGFDSSPEYDGNGLLSMRKRAADLGARLDIFSSPGEGTTLVIRFPATKATSLRRSRV